MDTEGNDAPLLIDVSRLVWRRWSGTRATGIDRICHAWLEYYASQAQAVIIHRHGKAILPERMSRKLFDLLLRPERSKRDMLQFRLDMVRLSLGYGTYLKDRLSGRGRVWLNAGHTGLDVPGIAEWCGRRKLRPVYLVHDLIPITHPQFCRAGEEERHRHRIRTMLATAAGVVANSQDTLQCYESFALKEGLPTSPSIVSWPGTHHLVGTQSKLSEQAYYIVLGTIEGRKNHKLLLSVWHDLVAQAKSARVPTPVPKLVIVGRRGWQAEDVFALLEKHDFGGHVIEAGPLPDAQLAQLLMEARALLFPSFVEGFGMPLVEALAAGVPVIASNLPVFREVGQNVPCLLPVSDKAAWREAVLEYARHDSAARSLQLARMAQFRAPTWAEHFAKIDAFISELRK